jgi:UDPglucose 6-dehydrogenase
LGNVLQDLERPDVVLIGSSDDRSAAQLERFYREAHTYKDMHKPVGPNTPVVIPHNPPIYKMSFVNAEVAKLALNCFVTMKISFANTIGMVAESIAGGDADAILGAVGADSRVGHKYLRVGPGWGGPCFPRDNEALLSKFPDLFLPEATIKTNRWSFMHLVDTVERWTTPEDRVGVLGVAYKPNTNVTERSQGKMLAEYLKVRALVYDPLVEATYPLTLEYVLSKADVLVVMLPLPEFRDLSGSKAKVIIDPWRHVENPGGARLVQFGRYNG